MLKLSLIRKTDRYFRRKSLIWETGIDEVIEYVRRESWWFLFLPIFIKDTIIEKQK